MKYDERKTLCFHVTKTFIKTKMILNYFALFTFLKILNKIFNRFIGDNIDKYYIIYNSFRIQLFFNWKKVTRAMASEYITQLKTIQE